MTIDYGTSYMDDGSIGDAGNWWKPAIVYDFGGNTYYVERIETLWSGEELNMGWRVTQFGATEPTLTPIGDLSGTFNCLPASWTTITINSGTPITGKVAFIIETAGNHIYWDTDVVNHDADWNYWADGGWWHYYEWASEGVNAIRAVVNTINPLPVELVSFNAKVVDQNVLLNWKTATEVRNYGFEIERNIPIGDTQKGKFIIKNDVKNEGWEVVGFVNGHGDANSENSYSFVDKKIANGIYVYRLKQIDVDGKYDYSTVVEVSLLSQISFGLDQNYPNPFNPSTKVSFSLNEDAFTNLTIYNILGEKVKTIVNENLEKGVYSFNINAAGLASGTYIYTLQAGDQIISKKMNLVK
jgi:hypothetical protein